MTFRRKRGMNTHTKIIILMIAVIIVVILSPYLMKAYYISTNEPNMNIQVTSTEKEPIGNQTCEITTKGEIEADYKYPLDEVNLEAEIITEGKGEEKSYYRYPEKITNVSGTVEFNALLEDIPENCKSIKEVEISIDSYGRSVF